MASKEIAAYMPISSIAKKVFAKRRSYLRLDVPLSLLDGENTLEKAQISESFIRSIFDLRLEQLRQNLKKFLG